MSEAAAWSGDIALLISDMDGTLVTPDKVLTPRAIEAVARLEAAGIGFSLISARPPRGMATVAKTLDIKLPMAAFNGGDVVGPDLALIRAYPLPAQVARQILDLLAKRQISPWVFADGEWLLLDPHGPKIDRELRAVEFGPTVVADFDAVIERIDKIVGVSDDHDLLERTEIEAKALVGEDAATIQRSQPYYLDVTHRQANKGDGVIALCAEIGVDLARTAVIGDMFNDVAMFKVAGFSIAMGQAPQAVRDQARVVTGPNTADGFADAVERLLQARAAMVEA